MITPKQIPNEKQREDLARAEKALDKFLFDNYKGIKLYVGIQKEWAYLASEFRFVLFEQYRQSGWDVSFNSDTVDGLPAGPFFEAK